MTNIDDKIISASFESSKFEAGVSKTLLALEKLRGALKFPDAGKDLEKFNDTAKRTDLSHIGHSVDEITSKLKAFHIAALAIFVDVAKRAVYAGTSFVKAFTLDPVKAGFAEYSTNLNAVQTILANTQASGAGLKDVNAALLNLNKYSDQTIYNFSQMAKNIGTFTAAGVDLETATGAIKGIANLAALSGSNSEQASNAMYQLSQAISAGRVSLQDWNSVVNAGMGGTVFQRALAKTAVAMGELDQKSLKLTGSMKNVSINGESFRQSIQAGPGKNSWLSSKVLTNTLKQFTGDLSEAELKAQGFAEADILAIQKTAKTAKHAATEVKTIQQVLDVAKESAGSGWAQTWQLIFGNFGEAKKTFTGLSNAINGFINDNANARNKVLKDWKQLGGRTILINGIKLAFHNLGEVLKPIKEAFREFFPPTTGQDLVRITRLFVGLTERLKPSKQTIENLRRTFRGLFALLDIGKHIFGEVFTLIRSLFGAVGGGQGGFLKFTAAIGDNLVALHKWLIEGGRLHDFFRNLNKVLSVPLEFLRRIAAALSNLFSGFSPGGFSDSVDRMTVSLTPLERILRAVSDAWENFTKSFTDNDIESVFESIGNAINGIGVAIGKAASNMNFDVILSAIRTGLFAALVVMFKQFLGKGSFAKQLGLLGGGLFRNISQSFGALTGSMKAMQRNIQAKTLKEIAIAIALLTASVVALSFVDPKKLKASLTALAVTFGELIGAMAIIDKISKGAGFVRLPFIAASMIALATAIDILVIAVIALSRLEWEELLRGLTGVGALLAGVSAASIPLSANSAGMVRAGIGITAIAVAMNILARAVEKFAGMSWTEISKGLSAIAVGLTTIVLAMTKLPKNITLQSAALIGVAVALNILAKAVEKFGKMNIKTLGKGLGAMAISLGSIAVAMKLMPKNMIQIGAGLVLVSGAMLVISKAIEKMGGLSIKELAKGLGGLAGALVILGLSLKFMKANVKGALALGIVAAGMALLAPALVMLGRMSWEQILKSLVGLAGALTVLGVAGALISPMVPALIGLGAALTLIGGGLALAGAGIFLISSGLAALSIAGPASVGILIAAINELLAAIPEMSKNFVLGILAVVQAFAKTAPQFVDAMIKIIGSLLDAIIKSAPKIADAFSALIVAALRVLHDNQNGIIQAGFDLILALLKGIRDNIGKIVKVAIDVIVNFLTAIARNLGRIITAGAKILISLIGGIAKNLPKVVTAVYDIFTNFLGAIAKNLPRVVTAGFSIIIKLVKGISDNVQLLVDAGTDAIVNFVRGIGKAGERIVRAATEAAGKFIRTLAKELVKLADAALDAVVIFLNGIADAIDSHIKEIRHAGLRIAGALIDGLTFGLAGKAKHVADQAVGIGKSMLSGFGSALGIHSPSKEMEKMGRFVVQGFANGLSDATEVVKSTKLLANAVIGTVEDTFIITSPSKVMEELGKRVGEGFAKGIRGTQDDIRNSITEMRDALKFAAEDALNTISAEHQKIAALRAEGKKLSKADREAITESLKTIALNQDILAKVASAHVTLTKSLKDEKKELLGLAGQYQTIADKLDRANQKLADAKQTRDDAVKSFKDQYSTLPDIVTEDAEGQSVNQLAAYMDALTNQANAVAAYQDTLQQLRKLGLDDKTYQKLLDEGTADQQFATQLLAGGKTAVDSLNALDAQLMKVSTTLATNSAKNLYQAGVDAAQGLVDGLKSKKSDLRKAMDEIAKEMVGALKKELKIKSPSEVFAEIGHLSIAGMAQGISDSSNVLNNAVDEAARDALATLRRSMTDISNAISGELDTAPVISPILDLTTLRSQAQQLASMTSVPISASASLGDTPLTDSQDMDPNDVAGVGGTSIKFEQTNVSPKALSEIEIYRLTKNQLSQLKSILPS